MLLKHRSILKMVGLIIFFVVVAWFANQVKDNANVQDLVQHFGYVGVFILAFLSGFNLILPVPAITFLSLFTEAGLNLYIIITIMSVAMSLGDAIGYILGRFGRETLIQSPPAWLERIDTFLSRHRFGIPIFFYLFASFAPLPNEVVVIPAGVTKQKWWLVLIPVLLGNTTSNILIAFGILNIFT